MTTRKYPIVPKNGRYLIALLAGGPKDIAGELRTKLANEKGILIEYHFEYKRSRAFLRPIPNDVDMIIVLKDMISHSEQDLIKEKAKSAGIPMIRTQRKWATMQNTLTAVYGIRHTENPLFTGNELRALPMKELGDAVAVEEVTPPAIPFQSKVEEEVLVPVVTKAVKPTEHPDNRARIFQLATDLQDLVRASGYSALLITADEINLQTHK